MLEIFLKCRVIFNIFLLTWTSAGVQCDLPGLSCIAAYLLTGKFRSIIQKTKTGRLCFEADKWRERRVRQSQTETVCLLCVVRGWGWRTRFNLVIRPGLLQSAALSAVSNISVAWRNMVGVVVVGENVSPGSLPSRESDRLVCTVATHAARPGPLGTAPRPRTKVDTTDCHPVSPPPLPSPHYLSSPSQQNSINTDPSLPPCLHSANNFAEFTTISSQVISRPRWSHHGRALYRHCWIIPSYVGSVRLLARHALVS